MRHISADAENLKDLELSAREIADIAWLAMQSGVSEETVNTDEETDSSDTEQNNKPSSSNGSNPDNESDNEPGESNPSENPTKQTKSKDEGNGPPANKETGVYADTGQEKNSEKGQPGTPIQVPAANSLPHRLSLARALRPLMRKIPSQTDFELDEVGTAELSAEHDAIFPVFRPQPVRWLDIIFIMDGTPTMMIWEETAQELLLLLRQMGAFDDVRSYRMVTKNDKDVTDNLLLQTGKNHVSPKEILNRHGRELVIIFSDCTADVWANGTVEKLINSWAPHALTTIMQPLPMGLWNGSALSEATQVFTRAKEPAGANANLQIELPKYLQLEAKWTEGSLFGEAHAIPTVSLTSAHLEAWAHFVTERGQVKLPAFYLTSQQESEEEQKESKTSDTKSHKETKKLTSLERITHFQARATPLARQLAGYLAGVPLTLPLIRLVQREMLPQSDQTHLAEILRSRLIDKSKNHYDPETNVWSFDFHKGIRKLLSRTVSPSSSLAILEKISKYIETTQGEWSTFRAWVSDPNSKDTFISKEEIPFAEISIAVLKETRPDLRLNSPPTSNQVRPQTKTKNRTDQKTLDGLRHEFESGTLPENVYRQQVTQLTDEPVAADPAERSAFIGRDMSSIVITGDNNSVKNIIRQTPDLDENNLRAEIGRYLNWVIDNNRSIVLRGVQHAGQSVIELGLEQVYVPLQARATVNPRVARRSERMAEEAQAREITLDQLLSLGNRLVITGGPGSGKSTVLMHLAWVLATALGHDDEAFAAERLQVKAPLQLPIIIPINRYANHLQKEEAKNRDTVRTSLAAFISEYLIKRQMSLSLPDAFFQSLIRQGEHILLLLDGLDEVPSDTMRQRVTQAIEDLVKGRPDLRVVVTCRSVAYSGPVALGQEFREVAVQPLDEEHVVDLVRHAYRAVYPHRERLRAEMTDDLLTGIKHMEAERRTRLGDRAERLVNSPLLVRMLLLLHLSERRLPQQRAELYSKATDNMIMAGHHREAAVREELANQVAGKVQHLELVQYVAFEMHRRGETQGRDIDEHELKRLLKKQAALAKLTEKLIAATRQRGTLMEERTGTYRFINLSFQEFLVAGHMRETLWYESELPAFVQETGCLTDSWWREPLLLLAGDLSINSTRQAEKYIRYLAGLGPQANAHRSVADRWAGAELAGTAVLEWPGAPNELSHAVVQQLVHLANEHNSKETLPHTLQRIVAQRLVDLVTGLNLPHTLIMQVGQALNRLGDPRPGIGLTIDGLPNIVWGKTISADTYMIGGDPDAKRSFDKQQVTIKSAYQLARYPVTYAQFQAFVSSDDYDDKRWWRGMPNDRRELREQQFQYANHPREQVTWYQAIAFCRWLSDKLGYEVILPHEYEWEVAARYNDGRQYPWGEQLALKMANTEKDSVIQTTAAGLYSSTQQAELGLYDMSSNVFEWCLNKYDNPAQTSIDDTGAYRALRGGSRHLVRCDARAASRYDGSPFGRNYDLGFRLVRRVPDNP